LSDAAGGEMGEPRPVHVVARGCGIADAGELACADGLARRLRQLVKTGMRICADGR
jgi:hypothetical protein